MSRDPLVIRTLYGYEASSGQFGCSLATEKGAERDIQSSRHKRQSTPASPVEFSIDSADLDVLVNGIDQAREVDGDDDEEGREGGSVQTRGVPASVLVLPGSSKGGSPATNQGLTTAPRRRFSRRGARKASSLLAATELVLMLASSVARPKAKVQKKPRPDGFAGRSDDDLIKEKTQSGMSIASVVLPETATLTADRYAQLLALPYSLLVCKKIGPGPPVRSAQPSSAKAVMVTQTDLMKNSKRIFRGWISNRRNWNAQNARYSISLLPDTPAYAGEALG
ncbi:hypothetical protein DL770_000588 [Monosporascus sp. CRB-9-2]|nr:hypothetical protein DL770_000588 [Monosporascus sp. CRB-9-2]